MGLIDLIIGSKLLPSIIDLHSSHLVKLIIIDPGPPQSRLNPVLSKARSSITGAITAEFAVG